MKGEFDVPVPAEHAFAYLSDEKNRLKWDDLIVYVYFLNSSVQFISKLIVVTALSVCEYGRGLHSILRCRDTFWKKVA